MDANRDVRKKILISVAGGAVIGGISVLFLANLIPRMMSRMMEGMMANMMAGMETEGCRPEEF